MVAAADMAATWFEESVPGPAIVADLAPAERLRSSAQWALGADGNDALKRLNGTTQRAVYDGARSTTLANVERTKSRWAREARPDACAFCRLLATRSREQLYLSHGIVFDKELGAHRTKVVGRRGRARGTQALGDRYHDDCRCIAVEVPNPESYVLSDQAQQWQDEYLKARANAGTGDVKEILAAWRTQAPEIN